LKHFHGIPVHFADFRNIFAGHFFLGMFQIDFLVVCEIANFSWASLIFHNEFQLLFRNHHHVPHVQLRI
jgi:hypothetical protein